MRYVYWLWRHARVIRWCAAWRVVAGVGQVALGLLMVWLSRTFIDETLRAGSSADVARMAFLLLLTVVGSVALRQLGYWLTVVATVRQTNALRLHLYRRLFRRRLFDGRPIHSGDVASRLAKDIDQVGAVTADTVPQMLVTLLQLVGAFLLMRWFDARLAWALLVLTPLAVLLGKVVTPRLRQMTLAIRRDESRIQMQVQETMEHDAMLRALGSAPWMTARLDAMQGSLSRAVGRRARFAVAMRLVVGATFGLGYLLAFVWGGLGLRAGTVSFGVMTSFLQLVGMIQHPIIQLVGMVPGLIHATASIDRLEELVRSAESEADAPVSDVPLSAAPVTDEPLTDAPLADGHASVSSPSVSSSSSGSTTATSSSSGSTTVAPSSVVPTVIRFSDVSFRYAEGEAPVLDGFSRSFRLGAKVAIVGATGAGKTTLFRLLLGLVRPTAGCVEHWGRLCYVPQGNTLMSGTLRDNLLLARPDATDRQMLGALHLACADFVGDLPGGLDAQIGERGSGLSEGQAQRIAIARGLLHGGDIFLFDEISSALDEATERILFTRLLAACPAQTILLITHHPSVARLCDEVVEL